jgi:hypothetical protein
LYKAIAQVLSTVETTCTQSPREKKSDDADRRETSAVPDRTDHAPLPDVPSFANVTWLSPPEDESTHIFMVFVEYVSALDAYVQSGLAPEYSPKPSSPSPADHLLYAKMVEVKP